MLRRLEAAWVPYMASLYVVESGKGPDWRAARLTVQNLILSLQAPDSDATREKRLQSIPAICGAASWPKGPSPKKRETFSVPLRPPRNAGSVLRWGNGKLQPVPFRPRASRRRRKTTLPCSSRNSCSQAIGWTSTHPTIASRPLAWHRPAQAGRLLFCDSEGERHFSLDCGLLGAEIRAGRARIPERSLTRNAMLRLKTRLKTAQA